MIGPELLYQTVKAICLSVYRRGVRKFVFLNGHSGHTLSLERGRETLAVWTQAQPL